MQLKMQTSHSVFMKTTDYVLIFLFRSHVHLLEIVGMYLCPIVLTFCKDVSFFGVKS